MEKNRYYKSASFPLVAFLLTKGEQVAGIYPTDNPSKKEFSFVSNPRLEDLVDKYRFGDRSDPELLVPVHKYEQARNELLDRLNE